MENSLWTFGCSFTAEYHPIDNDPPTTYDFYKQYNGGELPKVWPEHLSEKLGLKYENKGRGATSNASIFYSFCNFCDKLQEGDIVIVQWTTIYRFLLANDSLGELCDILPSCEYPDNEYDMDLITAMLVNRSNPIWIDELISYSKIINEICKEKKVKLFYWTYAEHEVFSYMQDNWDEFSWDNILTYKEHGRVEGLLNKMGIDTNNRHTIDNETDGEVLDAHLGKLGHEAQANYFYKIIKKQI